eukprot:CAMPEP_0183744026 /NCGR_PEP_ID=MMETSP0737-20130205/65519_1 /TAXON_ID=385413 /ORGANISM="Thalassiosira miniscula, Strain CCMP1093" /LENGTH=368 /DNA_ID=CAMNT_0025979661 /DNA_START=159 /DNA_END=1265 /DNA_ORIENTATION=-
MNYIFLAAVALVASVANASSEVKVVVYDGPKKCSNKEGDEKLMKVEADCTVGLHFTVTIDESSVGSRENIGRKIESSRDGMGVAPSFPVGQGRVIAGLDQGLIGLCRGASAYIIVPPHLAYGRYGKPEQGVGGDTTLRYDVEIADIQPPVPNDFIKIDSNKDWKISKKEAKSYFEGKGQAIDIKALWKAEDKDGDGYISWEEFSGPKGSEPPPKKQPPPRRQTQQQQKQAEQAEFGAMFKDVDVDGDGKISKDELANKFKAAGREMTEEFWAEADPDGDGFVSLEEFVGPSKPQAEQKSGEDIGTIFQQIDVDGDGKISKDELANTFKAVGQEMTEEFWAESDPDGDGFVSFEEFVGSSEPAGKGEEL